MPKKRSPIDRKSPTEQKSPTARAKRSDKTEETKVKKEEINKTEKMHELTIRSPEIHRSHVFGSNIMQIERSPDEPLDLYYKRVGYIAKNYTPGCDFDVLVTNSLIWRNHVLQGMTYPTTVLRRIVI